MPATKQSRLTEGMVTDPAATRNKAATKSNISDRHCLPLGFAPVKFLMGQQVDVCARILFAVVVN